MKNIRTISLCFTALIGLTLSSCVSFNQAWNESVASYSAGNVSGPEGPWTGSWTTKTNGHTGDLRCIVSSVKGDPNTYQFRYHATWQEVFKGTYPVKYPVKKRGSSYTVSGGENLGMFGKFQHNGVITNSRFSATYKKNDGEEVGAFSMKRPAKVR